MEAADGNISWKPTLYRDSFWNDKNLNMLYTVETANIEQHPIIGSVATKFVIVNVNVHHKIRLLINGSILPLKICFFLFI